MEKAFIIIITPVVFTVLKMYGLTYGERANFAFMYNFYFEKAEKQAKLQEQRKKAYVITRVSVDDLFYNTVQYKEPQVVLTLTGSMEFKFIIKNCTGACIELW